MGRTAPSDDPDRGDTPIRVPGLSYLPRFLTTDEAAADELDDEDARQQHQRTEERSAARRPGSGRA